MSVGSRLRQLGTRRIRSFSAGFSPLRIADLAVWYDANDTASLTVDGSNKVSQWNDKSGNARHATQGTGANQPTLLTNQLNGRPGVRGYDNQFMTFSGPDLSGAAGFTVIAVGEMGSTTGEGVYTQIPGAGSNNGVSLWTGLWRSGRSGSNILFPTGAPSTSPGSPYIWIYRNDGTKTTANTKVLASWNATERVGTTTQDAGTPAAGTAYLLAAGAADSPSDTNIHEFLIISRNISDEERDALYTYLYNKWWPLAQAPAGISSGLSLWLDGNDASTLWFDASGNVGGWLDKSGNQRHATQATTTQRPSFTITNQVNGITVPRFDGTDDRLTIPHDTGLNLSSYTIFAIVDNDSTGSAFRAWIEKATDASPTNRKYFIGTNQDIGSPWSPSNMIVVADGESTSSGSNGIKLQSGSANVNQALVTFQKDGSSSATLWVNGTQVATVASPNSNTGNTSVMNVGGTNYPWLGKVAELIIYSGALSSTDRQAVQTYLSNKWLPTYSAPAGISSGLALWLDAADTSTLTLESGAVVEWRDKSGNYRHAQQATPGSRPAYVTSAINGLPALNFDGTDDFLATSGFSLSTVSLFVVVTARWTVTETAAFAGQNFTSKKSFGRVGSAGFDYIANDIRGVTDGFNSGTTGPRAIGQQPGGLSNGDVALISTLLGASGTDIRFNRSSIARVSRNDPPSTDSNGFAIGRPGAGYAAEYWNGRIAEVILFNRVVDNTERNAIEAYLRTKWGTP